MPEKFTTVTFKQLLAVIAVVASATFWVSNRLNQIDKNITRTNVRLKNIENSLDSRWSIQDMKIWSMELGLANETLVIPRPTSQGE